VGGIDAENLFHTHQQLFTLF